jgi:16S rRNA (guanine527-N7)-methyltransferase
MNSPEFRQLLRNRARNAGLSIDQPLVDRLDSYFRLLARWNARINLTGFSLDQPTGQAVDRLLIEPLRLAQALEHPLQQWVDLGSGGGSPAIPIQLYRPAQQLVLVESKARKAAFLREVARELRLDGVDVEVARIESITTAHRLAGRADLVTIRAVSLSEPILTALRTLLRSGGRAALIGTVRPEARLSLEAGFQIVPNVEFTSSLGTLLLSRA